jgi:hypothetical protein
MSLAASDMLLVMAPPIRLTRWLDLTITAKEKKGETVPAEIKEWLAMWDEIRSHVPVPVIDQATVEEWGEVGEVVGKYVTGGIT